MPYGDGTGPLGMGPMTGRAAGYCAGYTAPGFANPNWGGGYRGRGVILPYGGPTFLRKSLDRVVLWKSVGGRVRSLLAGFRRGRGHSALAGVAGAAFAGSGGSGPSIE